MIVREAWEQKANHSLSFTTQLKNEVDNFSSAQNFMNQLGDVVMKTDVQEVDEKELLQEIQKNKRRIKAE